MNLPYITLHFIQLQLSSFFTNQSVCTALEPHPNMDLTFLWAMSDRDCLLVSVFIYLYLSSFCFPCMHLRCSWDDHIGLHPTARWGTLKSALHLPSLKDICASSVRDSSSEWEIEELSSLHSLMHNYHWGRYKLISPTHLWVK